MLISKSNNCPNCGADHLNDCVAYYDNGMYCFSCGVVTLTKKKDYSYNKKQLTKSNLYIPETITFNPKEFSLDILSWLYKYNINTRDIIENRIGYIPYDSFTTSFDKIYSGESLIYLLFNDKNEIVYYQRRFFPSKQILSQGVNLQPIIYNLNSDNLVIVEDYISAIRCSRTANTLCLFGTKLRSDIIPVLRTFKNIYIWLDGDEPGQKASEEIYVKLCDILLKEQNKYAFKLTTKKIKIITTDKDPKTYFNIDIEEIING